MRENRIKKSLNDLFLNKYIKDIDDPVNKCWLIKHKNPYGRISYFNNNKRIYLGMHQASYIIHIGSIPDNMWVLHKCNNSYCCNPNHLYIGDRKQNEIDKVDSGIMNKDNYYNSKLSKSIVIDIKLMIKNNFSDRDIASKYNVKRSTINKVRNGRSWYWVK